MLIIVALLRICDANVSLVPANLLPVTPLKKRKTSSALP
jgi:hypothetical protein